MSHMATYQSGGRRTATANSVKAAERSATTRQCPKCGRKSAIRTVIDDYSVSTGCRWGDCNYGTYRLRGE